MNLSQSIGLAQLFAFSNHSAFEIRAHFFYILLTITMLVVFVTLNPTVPRRGLMHHTGSP